MRSAPTRPRWGERRWRASGRAGRRRCRASAPSRPTSVAGTTGCGRQAWTFRTTAARGQKSALSTRCVVMRVAAGERRRSANGADRPALARRRIIAVALFASWNNGLRAAGLQVNKDPGKWTPESVREALARLERELGRQPAWQDVRDAPVGYPGGAAIRRTFGSWATAARQLGWHVKQHRRCTDEEMIGAVRSAAAELGEGFALERYKDISSTRGWPSATAITARFGSWNAARDAAGIQIRRQERGWSAERLAVDVRALARRLGRTPMAHEWDQAARQHSWPHSATVARRLGHGSWEQAINAAGLEPRPRGA